MSKRNWTSSRRPCDDVRWKFWDGHDHYCFRIHGVYMEVFYFSFLLFPLVHFFSHLHYFSVLIDF